MFIEDFARISFLNFVRYVCGGGDAAVLHNDEGYLMLSASRLNLTGDFLIICDSKQLEFLLFILFLYYSINYRLFINNQK